MVSEGAEIGDKGVEKEVVTKRATLVEDKLLDKVTAKKIFLGSPISFTFKSGTGGLSEDTSDEDLRQYFSQYGVVAKVEQLVHPETGRKKGVAFISFDDDDCVDKIVLIGAHIIKVTVTIIIVNVSMNITLIIFLRAGLWKLRRLRASGV